MAKYGRWKQERTVSRLDGLVLLTQMDEKNWQGVTQTFVIPNSITFKSEKVSSCLNKKAICVGRYNEQKGYEYMVEAWSIVNMKHPDWTLQAYGAGELKDDIQKQIDNAGLNGKMILYDPVPNIMEKYVDSSIYIMTTIRIDNNFAMRKALGGSYHKFRSTDWILRSSEDQCGGLD